MRKVTTATDTTSKPTPAGVGGTYQSLDMTNSKAASTPYEALNSKTREPDKTYEDINSKTVKLPVTGTSSYASLGVRDQKQNDSYMTVNKPI